MECPPPTQTRRLRRKHRALVLAEAGPPPRGQVSAQRDRTPPTPRPSPQFPQLQGEEWPDPRLPWRSSACSDCCKHARPVSGRNEGRGTEFLPGPTAVPAPPRLPAAGATRPGLPRERTPRRPRHSGLGSVAQSGWQHPGVCAWPAPRFPRHVCPAVRGPQTRLAPARGFLSRPVRTRTRPDPDGRVPAAQETDQNNTPHIFRSLFEDLGAGGCRLHIREFSTRSRGLRDKGGSHGHRRRAGGPGGPGGWAPTLCWPQTRLSSSLLSDAEPRAHLPAPTPH